MAETAEQCQSIEAKLQQMENDRKEANWYVDRCSVRFDVQDVEAGIKQDNDSLWPLGHLLKPKSQVQSTFLISIFFLQFCVLLFLKDGIHVYTN